MKLVSRELLGELTMVPWSLRPQNEVLIFTKRNLKAEERLEWLLWKQSRESFIGEGLSFYLA